MIIGGELQLFSVPEGKVNSNTQPAGSAQKPPTPKISEIFENSNNIKVGYFGKLDFCIIKHILMNCLIQTNNYLPKHRHIAIFHINSQDFIFV